MLGCPECRSLDSDKHEPGCTWQARHLTVENDPARSVLNDYRNRQSDFTFWLFTKDGYAVKGEGADDYTALREVIGEITRRGIK